MGHYWIESAFSASADLFWTMVQPGTQPTQAMVLRALETVASHFRTADVQFNEDAFTGDTPLGRMLTIAFVAEREEINDPTGKLWAQGPLKRFREYFKF